MNWLNKLERKFGRFSIPGLPKYIILLYVVGIMVQFAAPELYSQFTLNPYLILHGQVWRIFTFLLIAPSTNLFFMIFVLLFYYSIASSLEQVWGSFRFTMYYMIGVLGTISGAFLTYLILVLSGGEFNAMFVQMDTFYLNLSLFLAYAMMFPDMQVLFYMIIPMKVKWLAYLDAAYLFYTFFIATDFTVTGISIKVSIVVALLNFVLFFFSTKKMKAKGAMFGQKVRQRKRKASFGESAGHAEPKKNGARHECAVCHRTELDDPTLEFRYCPKCEGNYEYCQDHLFTHVHVKKDK